MARARLPARAAIGLGAFALLQLATRGFYWFWPDNPDGLINEGLLLLLALLAGALALPLSAPRLGRIAGLLALAAPLYLGASMAWLALWPLPAAGFGTHRHFVFSAPFCEFEVRFPRPPQTARLPVAGSGAERAGRVALLSDLELLTAFRADCIAAEAAEPEALRAIARAGLGRWAEAAGLRETVERAQGNMLAIAGVARGSLVRSAGEGGRTLGEARAYIGARSVLTLGVLQSEGKVLNGTAADFLDSGRTKGGVDLDHRSGVK